MNSTPNTKDDLIARADEQIARAHEQIARLRPIGARRMDGELFSVWRCHQIFERYRWLSHERQRAIWNREGVNGIFVFLHARCLRRHDQEARR